MIDNKKLNKRGTCQCRNCGNVFNNTDIKHTYSDTLGQETRQNECPRCGSIHWGLMDEVFIKSDGRLYIDAKKYQHVADGKFKLA